MPEVGMDVRIHRLGNICATRAEQDLSLQCVPMGSHIDTVATGGDLGVLGAPPP